MKHRVKAQVDMHLIRNNFKYIKELVAPKSRVMAVVKADAYGHGASKVSRQLQRLGCTDFAVACLSEAQSLRESGVKGNILILGPTAESLASDIAKGGFAQTVDSAEYAENLARVGRIRVHIKVDTGMSRLGLYCHTAEDVCRCADEIQRIASEKNISVDGIFTHFADSDSDDRSFTDRQFAVFCALLDELKRRNVRVGLRHCCNSAATLKYPEMRLDMVRAGIILYGLMPSKSISDPNIHPCMRLTARVCAVHGLKKGDTVSYGCSYTAKEDTRVAVISVGYADGFSRVYSGHSVIRLNGKVFPTVGRICMDLCMLDIGTNFPCSVGDEAVIFETAEDIDRLADIMGTINYEVLCSLKHRVYLKYINQEK